MNLARARTVADAVLYEGYLLYPYRSTSRKNQVRWQFGVLGPPGAATAGLGEEPDMAAQCLLRAGDRARLEVRVRFLQLQTRYVERAEDDAAGDDTGGGAFTPVEELTSGDTTWVSWDEAVDVEIDLGPYDVEGLRAGRVDQVEVQGGEDVELLHDTAGGLVGRLVRRRWPLHGTVSVLGVPDGDVVRVETRISNVAPDPVADPQQAIRSSFIGAHLLLGAHDAAFVSVIDPPQDAREAASRCEQRRCWPVLAGAPGENDVVLVSPIILYDHPEVAPESAGALYDSTEIDEILTLRVMTLTEEEKAAARATDAHAAAIIDRCDNMSAEDMARLHGILRDPHADLSGALSTEEPGGSPAASFDPSEVPWWGPDANDNVQPEADVVMIDGVPVSKGSLVRLRPSRRADAQDLFFSGQQARVSLVHFDVDGGTHVGVVLLDDPASDMHDWYGRYLYFTPDEVEPLTSDEDPTQREESRS